MTSVAAPYESVHKTWVAGLATTTKPEPGHGALFGKQWEGRFLAEALYEAGFGCTPNSPALDLLIMLCVGLAESQGFDKAIHVNFDLTEDRGWLQLSSTHSDISDEDAYDIWAAAKWAKKLVDAKKRAGGEGFEDWVAFWKIVNGAPIYQHDTYLARGGRGVGNFLIDLLLNAPVPDIEQAYPHVLKTPVLNFEHRVATLKAHTQRGLGILGTGPKSADTVLKARQEFTRGLNDAKLTVPRP